jgi:hypothetical protein
MRAIHVNWTKPYFEKHRLRGDTFGITRELKSQTYDQPIYQILYTMLSAIHWKKSNGPIKLYTDSIGLNFYQQFHINELYDEIDINFLNGYSKTKIDPAYFWTSGKIKCLAHQTTPFVFLDQDMIIREPLPTNIINSDITITHWEIPRGKYYFEKEDWEKEISHIKFPTNYDCNDWAPNTSFLLINNFELLKEYHNWHKKLVNTNGEEIPEWFWLLTDQGILGHVIREGDYHVNALTNKIFLPNANYGTSKTRYKGIAENWYYPIDAKHDDYFSTDSDGNKHQYWEHVWLDKIHYYLLPNFREEQTQRFFDEIISLGYGEYLHNHARFEPYWEEHNKNK